MAAAVGGTKVTRNGGSGGEDNGSTATCVTEQRQHRRWHRRRGRQSKGRRSNINEIGQRWEGVFLQVK
jgi:hypothetical protein